MSRAGTIGAGIRAKISECTLRRWIEVPSYKVWLEEKGERMFEPAGKVPPKLLKPLREFLGQHRLAVEDRWVRFMLDKHWLHLHIALPKLTLVAYPNMPTKFTREIDLATWFDQRQLDSLQPRDHRPEPRNGCLAIVDQSPG